MKILRFTKKFQSTHPHGVRRLLPCHLPDVGGFNPRTRMGCDDDFDFTQVVKDSFNPRTRMGCDNDFALKYLINMEFQSTHPHGVRQPINYKNYD